MITLLGGHDVWARARSLHLRYEGVMQFAPPIGPRDDVEMAWRDLQEPNERIEHKAEGVDRVRVMTPRGAWRIREGAFTTISTAEHAADLAFWQYDFYTMLRRLAARDPHLVLRMQGPNRVIVSSRSGDGWGWFDIDERGSLLKWGATDTDGSRLDYVYGPLGSYGSIRFPRWVASVDGRWRADYTVVQLSEAALNVPLTPPHNERR